MAPKQAGAAKAAAKASGKSVMAKAAQRASAAAAEAANTGGGAKPASGERKRARAQILIKAEPKDEAPAAPPTAEPQEEAESDEEKAAPKKRGRGSNLSPEVAEMLANVAREQGKSIKALREQFKRTWHGDPRTAEDAKKRDDKTEKAPAEIAERMKSGESQDSWMKVWLSRGGSWLKAEASQTKRDEDEDVEGTTRAWLTEDQMEELYKSKIVVAALKRTYPAPIISSV